MTVERFVRGCQSFLGMLLFPLGKLIPVGKSANDPARLNRGLTLILTGVEGRSCLNHGIRQGLLDGGVQTAVDIVDWTTGCFLLFPIHLRCRRFARRRASQIAERIVAYRREYPDCPIHVIGHSGGCGIALAVLEALPADVMIDTVVFLAAAVSPRANLAEARGKVQNAFVCFYSHFDFVFLGLATILLGTMDGRHSVAAGCAGFCTDHTAERLNFDQRPFMSAMVRQFHLGGHFGWTNRVFVAETIAPLIIRPESRIL